MTNNLYENWEKTLKITAKINENAISIEDQLKEIIELPFIPVQMDSKSFYNLWSEFIALFMNPTATAVELLISDTQQIEKAFLHSANKKGNYIQLIELNRTELPIKNEDLSNIEAIFDRLKNWIFANYNQDLGNIRVISLKLITKVKEIYEKYTHGLQSSDLLKLVGEYFDTFSNAVKDKQFQCYPSSIFLDFISNFRGLFGNFSYLGLFDFLKKNLPILNLTMTFVGLDYYFTLKIHLEKAFLKIEVIPNDLKILKIEDPIERNQEILRKIAKKCKSKYNFLFQIHALKFLLQDILESPIPADQDRLNYLIQKILYGYSSLDKNWLIYPKPLIYNGGVRLLLFTLGYYLNLQRLSYWSLPELSQNLFNKVIGFEGKAIVIIGESLSQIKDPLTTHAVLLEFENKQTKALTVLSSEEIIEFSKEQPDLNAILLNTSKSQSKKSSKNSFEEQKVLKLLRQIRLNSCKKYGFVNSIVWVSTKVFPQLFSNMLIDLHSYSPLALKKLTKTLGLLKDPQNFAIIPDNIIYDSIKNTPSKKLLKKLSPILTDLHEF